MIQQDSLVLSSFYITRYVIDCINAKQLNRFFMANIRAINWN
uniref:Uncharacterized protein n=1 Tax=Yersinia enterocolitica W22703 TaxID=913028 RepID=F4N627_YEREN|nr:unknown protein [Yersinia enterocolitica W22703]